MNENKTELPNSEARITPRHERLADFLRYVRQFGVESVGDHSITVPTSADRLGHAMFSWSMFEQCIEILKSAEQSKDAVPLFGLAPFIADVIRDELRECDHDEWTPESLAEEILKRLRNVLS